MMADSERARKLGRRTVVFVDEIHRFNKAQQDAFLPYVERGDIILIGATTENPSFEVNSALLSRAKVYALRALSMDEIVTLLEARLKTLELSATRELLEQIAIYSNGDARTAYNILELASAVAREGVLEQEAVESVIERKILLYDKSGEEHFNLISALHKSIRSSDPDAALYWLARMLEAGEDRLYIARRLVRMAVEDIGLADPRALGTSHGRAASRALPRHSRRRSGAWRRSRFISRSPRNPTRRTRRWAPRWKRSRNPRRAGPDAAPQCADAIDEAVGLRLRLSARASVRGRG